MKEGIPQDSQSLCESGFGIPGPSHPGGVEMTCRERRAASETIPLNKLLH